MNLRKLWAIAMAEKRIVLGQWVYWLFLVFSYIQAIGLFIAQGLAHASYSTLSSTAGYPAPRNMIPLIALNYLVFFLAGVVFLSLNVRAQDIRARILEVLDSRPYSNTELVFGRFLGCLLCTWVPVLVLMLIIPALSSLLPLIHPAAGGVVDPLSLFAFAFYIALPALIFSSALVMLISLLIRQKIVTLILAAVIIGGSFYLLSYQPVGKALSLDLMGVMQINPGSEWVPSIAKTPWWLQRLGIVVLALGFLVYTIAIHPRLDGSNRIWQAIVASTLSAAGVALVVAAYQMHRGEFELVDRWRIAHEAKRTQVFPDIVSIQGTVAIDPQQEMSADLEVRFQAPAGQSLEKALFSLNPGFEISAVTDASGRSLAHTFQDGLLEVSLDTLSQTPTSSAVDNSTKPVSLQLQYHGRPDVLFGYLDTAIDLSQRTVNEVNRNLLFLDKAIYERNFVGLMPGIHWLPTAGVDVGRGDGGSRPRDFFELQLNVQLPVKWTAAGPGLRREVSRNDQYVEYRFAPPTAIPEVALMAAPFVPYATEIEGIKFELLLHPNHDSIIDAMAVAQPEIERWIGDRLKLVKEAGLEYPFRAFSLVEVPNTLRGFGGGWRMDTTLAPPAMVLMKEQGMPTARFDIPPERLDGFFRNMSSEDADEEPAIAARNRLLRFFSNDFGGGNVFSGFARSFFAHQTAATGKASIALDYALRQLAALVVSGERSYYSTESALRLYRSLDDILDQTTGRHKSVTEKVIDSFTSRPAVWEAALSLPLSEIKPWDDPALSVDVLALKSGQLAELIYHTLGPTQSGYLLAEILSNHTGSSYTQANVANTSAATEFQLGSVLEKWLTGEGLAGFITDRVQLFQLAENDNGESRYQLKMRIRNEEPADGFARVSWATQTDGDRLYSRPIRIAAHSAVEFGLVLSVPPATVHVEPYLSLNREEYRVQTFNGSIIARLDEPPFDGVRDVALGNKGADRIIIDDLDPGFTVVVEGEQRVGLLSGLFEVEETLDQGLPLMSFGFPNRWSRRNVDSAWGKYRHTIAYIGRGSRVRKAIFATELPSSGRWQLDIHLPGAFFDFNQTDLYGDWELALISGNGSNALTYNADAATSGWNTLGEYELPAGQVSLEISNQTDGRVVIADAVRWTPVN